VLLISAPEVARGRFHRTIAPHKHACFLASTPTKSTWRIEITFMIPSGHCALCRKPTDKSRRAIAWMTELRPEGASLHRLALSIAPSSMRFEVAKRPSSPANDPPSPLASNLLALVKQCPQSADFLPGVNPGRGGTALFHARLRFHEVLGPDRSDCPGALARDSVSESLQRSSSLRDSHAPGMFNQHAVPASVDAGALHMAVAVVEDAPEDMYGSECAEWFRGRVRRTVEVFVPGSDLPGPSSGFAVTRAIRVRGCATDGRFGRASTLLGNGFERVKMEEAPGGPVPAQPHGSFRRRVGGGPLGVADGRRRCRIDVPDLRGWRVTSSSQITVLREWGTKETYFRK
jgi:hypothetical protein